MALRPGDTVSLSVSPAVSLTKYQFLKAHATVTRKLGDDPEADLADMRVELRRVYMAAVHDELTMMGELTELIRGDGSSEAIAAYALQHSKIHATKKSSQARRPARRV